MLVDTSVWIDHFHKSDRRLDDALRTMLVRTHPFVIGELAIGTLSSRSKTLRMLKDLSVASVATDDETFVLIEEHRLHGRGLGWVDAHLLASCLLTGIPFWTRDKRLREAASGLGIDTI